MLETVLALDVGTSVVKAVLLDRDGVVHGRAATAAPEDTVPGTDPQALWQVVEQVLGQLVAASTRPVAAVVISGQGDGLWSIDRDGAPQRAYAWNTVDAAEVVQRWERDGTIEAHFRRSGTVLWPGTDAAVWRWLEAQDPDRIARTGTVFCAKDWIGYRLTGVAATDVTDASIAFLDLASRSYDPRALEGLGCQSIAERLPPALVPGEVLGGVTAAAAVTTGLAEGTPVHVGCLDLIAMIRAAGLRDPGDALAVLGTTAVAVSVLDDLPVEAEPSGATVAMPEPGRYLRVLGANSGTTTLEWFLRTHGYTGDDRHDRFWDDVNAAGDQGALLLPFLAGERAPFLAPEATGAFLGLTAATTLGGMGHGVVTGITHALKHCLDAAGAGEDDLVLTGGGATRPEWCQLVADVLDRPVLVEARADLGALGAASLVPGFEQLAGADDTQPRARVTPAAGRDRAAERHTAYLDVVEALRPLFKELPRP